MITLDPYVLETIWSFGINNSNTRLNDQINQMKKQKTKNKININFFLLKNGIIYFPIKNEEKDNEK